MRNTVMCHPDAGEKPNVVFLTNYPEPLISLRLASHSTVTVLTDDPGYLIDLANCALEGIAQLTSRGQKTLTKEQVDSLDATSLRVIAMQYAEDDPWQR